MERYTKKSDYIFDRWIFRGSLIIIFLVMGTYLYLNDFDLDYYSCMAQPGETCLNPFYKESWKNSEILIPGEYGKDPSWLRDLKISIFLVFSTAFIINHISYNKGKKPIRRLFKYVKNNYKSDD